MYKIFKNVGDKLKYLRKIGGFTQEDLGGKIGKSTISKVEHNKKQLKKSDADYIAERINAKLSRQKTKIPFRVSGLWLIADVNLQISLFVKDYISKVVNNPSEIVNIEDEISEIQKIGKIRDKQLYVIYKILVDYYEKNDRYIAKKYLVIMNNMANKNNNISKQIYTLKRLTNICIFLSENKEVIMWGNMAIALSKITYIKSFMRDIYFNMLLANVNLEDQIECNKCLTKLGKFKLDKVRQIDFEYMRAKYESKIGNSNKAEKILKSIIEEKNIDNYRQANNYMEMAKIKYGENKYVAVKYIEKAIEFKLPDGFEFKYVEAEIIYTFIKIYIKFKKDTYKIDTMFKRICDISKAINNYDSEMKCIISLGEFYNKNTNKIELLLREIESIKEKDYKTIVLYYKIVKNLYINKDKIFKLKLDDAFNLLDEVHI